ncbi:MAG: hypothetical protein B7Y89_03485 [Novosphingobium sp. 32-60-15]|jgi:hypothetical protein|uniref:hypothetical protein n=1 Tax=unclassified Novosphingobium TaxID=2644732 RepID=UPI000BD96DDA|nr:MULTISPECIES: hypothetical protein [unclassified Novosphingobium]OYX64097.1 MAG: hypothetical protein B7Y89_03485 [Novosphingobium sp. 32-60-15]
MKLLRVSLSSFALLLSAPAFAGFMDGAGAVAKLMAQYKGRPAQELVDALGDATDQKQVLDNIVISGGFDSDDGPSCTWKIVADKDRIIKDISVFGNPWGCGPVAKNLKKFMKEHPLPLPSAS